MSEEAVKVSPSDLCVKLHRKILRFGVHTVPSISEMKNFVTCLEYCTDLLGAVHESHGQDNKTATEDLSSDADPLTKKESNEDGPSSIDVVRPFMEDSIREIIKCTLDLIPQSISSPYAGCMRSIVTLGATVARLLLEAGDHVLVDVLDFCTRSTHAMYVGKLMADGSRVRGSSEVRDKIISNLSLPPISNILLQQDWVGAAAASAALSILKHGIGASFEKEEVQLLLKQFLEKLRGFEATSFDLVNKETDFENLLDTLLSLAGPRRSCHDLLPMVTAVWAETLLKLFVSPNLQKRLFAIKGFLEWTDKINTNVPDGGLRDSQLTRDEHHQVLLDFIDHHHVIELLFERMHQQCLIQSRGLFVYLAKMRSEGHRNTLSDAKLLATWQRCVAAPEYLAAEICTLIACSLPHLPETAVSHILQHVTLSIRDRNAPKTVLRRVVAFVKSLQEQSWLCTDVEAAPFGPQPTNGSATNSPRASTRILQATTTLIWTCLCDAAVFAELRRSESGRSSGPCSQMPLGTPDDAPLSQVVEYFISVLQCSGNIDVQKHFIAQSLQCLQSNVSVDDSTQSARNVPMESKACFAATALSVVKGILEAHTAALAALVDEVDRCCGSIVGLVIEQVTYFASGPSAHGSVPHLRSMLAFITYCTTHTKLSLQREHVQMIWNALRKFHEIEAAGGCTRRSSDCQMAAGRSGSPSRSPSPGAAPPVKSSPNTDLLFVFFKQLAQHCTEFDRNQLLLKHVFEDYICHVNANHLPLTGFDAFQYYMLCICNSENFSVSTQHSSIRILGVRDRSFIGKKFLWQLILDGSTELSQKAIGLYRNIFLQLSEESVKLDSEELLEAYVIPTLKKAAATIVDLEQHPSHGNGAFGAQHIVPFQRVLRVLCVSSLLIGASVPTTGRCHFSACQGRTCELAVVLPAPHAYTPLVFHLDKSAGLHSRSTMSDVRQLIDRHFKNLFRPSSSPWSANLFNFYLHHSDPRSASDAASESRAPSLQQTVDDLKQSGRRTRPYNWAMLNVMSHAANVSICGEGKLLDSDHLTFVQLGISDKAVLVMQEATDTTFDASREPGGGGIQDNLRGANPTLWHTFADSAELKSLLLQILDGLSRLCGSSEHHHQLRRAADWIWEFLQTTPTNKCEQSVVAQPFASSEALRDSVIVSSAGGGPSFATVYRIQALSRHLCPVAANRIVLRPVGDTALHAELRELQRVDQAAREKLVQQYTAFVNNKGFDVIVNYVTALDDVWSANTKQLPLHRSCILAPLQLLRAVLLHKPYNKSKLSIVRPRTLPPDSMFEPVDATASSSDPVFDEKIVSAILFEGHFGPSSAYQGLFRRVPGSQEGGSPIFLRDGQIDSNDILCYFSHSMMRWCIGPREAKQPPLFSACVPDASIASLVTVPFQYVSYSAAKYKGSGMQSCVNAQQLRCFPLRDKLRKADQSSAASATMQTEATEITQRIRSCLEPSSFLQKLISVAINESRFHGPNSSVRDIVHDEILDCALHLVVFVIKTYPTVAENVILDTNITYGDAHGDPEATHALPELLGMLLLHRKKCVRVRLAEAFAAFAAISPRSFRAVLRQSLDDLVNLKDVYTQSASFASSVAQFFEMTTTLAHSSMGRSLMAQGSSEFVRYIPMLLAKVGVAMPNFSNKTEDTGDGGTTPFMPRPQLPQEVITGFLSLVQVLVASADVSSNSEDARIVDALLEHVLEDCLFRIRDRPRSPSKATSSPSMDNHGSPRSKSTEAKLSESQSKLPIELIQPLSKDESTRRQTFRLLLEIVKGSPTQLLQLTSRLRSHLQPPDQHTPLKSIGSKTIVDFRRSSAGFVGLTNQGLTCYMNATLQQLFFLKRFREEVLSARLDHHVHKGDNTDKIQDAVPPLPAISTADSVSEDDGTANSSDSDSDSSNYNMLLSMLNTITSQGSKQSSAVETTQQDEHDIVRQLQQTLLFLQESRVRHYDPAPLVAACTNLGLEFGVYAQNDARDFMDRLLDRCEKTFKTKSQSSALDAIRWHFGGKSANENIRACGHNSSSEQPFYLLEVVIKGCQTLHDALRNMVAGESMVGDNRLSCDSCDSKVDAVRRFCIKTLPNTLVLQLKRFDLDFSVFQLYKLNSRLEFPFQEVLDMYPYTHAGLREKDELQKRRDGDSSELEAGGNNEETNDSGGDQHALYRLRGVVIHMGEAGGGHYYSLIRNDDGKWSKFDDEDVQPFDVRDFAYECFGGTEEVMTDVKGHKIPRQRDISHNAYMLFYERVHPLDPCNDDKDEGFESADEDDAKVGTSNEDPADSTDQQEENDDSHETVVAAGHEYYADAVLQSNRAAIQSSLLLDPALNEFLFLLFEQMADMGKSESHPWKLDSHNELQEIAQFLEVAMSYNIEVTYFPSALARQHADPRFPWPQAFRSFVSAFPSFVEYFRSSFAQTASTVAENGQPRRFVRYLLEKLIVHPNQAARQLIQSVLQSLLLVVPHATREELRVLQEMADGGASGDNPDVSLRVAESLIATAVTFLPLLQSNFEQRKRGREFVGLLEYATSKHQAYFAGQGQNRPTVDVAAIWLHFLCGGASPLQPATARAVAEDIIETATTDLDTRSDGEEVDDDEDDDDDYDPEQSHSNDGDDDDDDEDDHVSLDADDESVGEGQSEANDAEEIEGLQTAAVNRRAEGVPNKALGELVVNVPCLRKWSSSKVGVLTGPSMLCIFRQLANLLLYKRDQTREESELDRQKVNKAAVAAEVDGVVRMLVSAPIRTRSQKPVKQCALTDSVRACLFTCRSLWSKWVEHFAEPELFATYVGDACRDDADLSKKLMDWLITNVDEKGYQKPNRIKAFKRPDVLLHGEDALANIAAIDDALRQQRMSQLFDVENGLLERVRLWRVNSATTTEDRRINAVEVVRLLRLLLRLYRDLPLIRSLLSTDPLIWLLADLVFYIKHAEEEFRNDTEWQNALRASARQLQEHFNAKARSPTQSLEAQAAEPTPVKLTGDVIKDWCKVLQELGKTEEGVRAHQEQVASNTATHEDPGKSEDAQDWRTDEAATDADDAPTPPTPSSASDDETPRSPTSADEDSDSNKN